MRTSKAFLSLGLMAAAGLLAATAMAVDEDPTDPKYKSCPLGSFTVSTEGPMPCVDDTTNTCVTYTVGGTGTPDHVGTFVWFENQILGASGTYNVTVLGGQGDGTLGVGNGLLSHERLIHWNNAGSKQPASSFTFKVKGNRKPMITSVVVKKGGSQWSCPLVGVGLEAVNDANCVSTCGNFNIDQTIRTTEVQCFQGCCVQFNFDPNNGDLVGVDKLPPISNNPKCQYQGDDWLQIDNIGELKITLPNGQAFPGKYGNGWISHGTGSCTTYGWGGSAFTWPTPCN